MLSVSLGDQQLQGLALIGGGGVCSGLFLVPMGWMTWKWENIWLVYSLCGMLILPWAVNIAAVPHLGKVYVLTDAEVEEMLYVALLGVGWGLSSVTFGLGTRIVGNSLGFSIILSLTCTLGGTVVLLDKDFEQVHNIGEYYWGGMALALLGMALQGRAGTLKERQQRKSRLEHQSTARLGTPDRKRKVVASINATPVKVGTSASFRASGSSGSGADVQGGGGGGGGNGNGSGRFALGLALCIVSGMLSPMLNLGLALGDRVRERALGSESPSSECLSNGSAAELLFASNAVWALCVGTGGALVNVGFALVLIFKHRSCRHFCGKRKSTGLLEHDRLLHEEMNAQRPCYHAREGSTVHWVYTLLMGVLWFGGINLYSVGAEMLEDGTLGDALGWPLYVIVMVLTGNLSGVVAGEWRGTTGAVRGTMALGLVLLFGAILIMAFSATKAVPPRPPCGGSDSGSDATGRLS